MTVINKGVLAEVNWDAGFYQISQAYKRSYAVKRWADTLALEINSIIKEVPEDGSGLIVSHGGVVEGTIIGLYPDFDYSNWNHAVSYCEGVKVFFQDDEALDLEYLQVELL